MYSNFYLSWPNSQHSFSMHYKNVNCSCCKKLKPVLNDCKKCGKAFYCSDLCKNSHATLHAQVCDSFKVPTAQDLPKNNSIRLVGL